MTASRVPPDLIQAYLEARYRVGDGTCGFTFRLQEYSPQLAAMLADARPRSAAFITAHNPYSDIRDAAANQRANRRLRLALARCSDVLFAATGEDVSDHWPPEPGFLALGVELDQARALGREFEQNAIVWIAADAVPRLELLR